MSTQNEAKERETTLRNALYAVIDPELGINIVDLGLVYDIAVDGGDVTVTMTMTSPACPLGRYLTQAVQGTLKRVDGVSEVAVDIVWEPRWQPEMMSAVAQKHLGW